MSEETKVGEIVKFFAKPSVAAIKVTAGEIKVGDELHYKGATTDFTEVVESMEVDNESVTEAASGALVGIKVADRVRPGDGVYKVSA
jgi:putative protease